MRLFINKMRISEKIVKKNFFLPGLGLTMSFVVVSLALAQEGRNLQRQAAFATGIDDRQTSAWSQWKAVDPQSGIEVPEDDSPVGQSSFSGPGAALGPLDSYQTSAQDNPVIIALKIDDMISGLSQPILDLETNPSITHSLPQDMLETADAATAGIRDMYADIQGMSRDIDVMKGQLNSNYAAFNNAQQTDETVREFNAQSDAMADRVSGMRNSLKGMTRRVETSRDLLGGMFGVLDEMEQNGKRALRYYDRLSSHIKDVAMRFEAMAKDLDKQGFSGKESVEQTRRYLSSLQDYVQGHKPYTGDEMGYAQEVKKYLQGTRGYFTDILNDFEKIGTNLKDMELYFHKSKIHLSSPVGIIDGAEGNAGSVCEGAKKEGLKELRECSKSCRSVCRFKERVEGVDCYECPSGSPDTCFDLAPPAWPDQHPWCQPGGICHSDPMLYCEPFGTYGPNKERLQCTNCKKRPDMCWQNVGDGTMTYTNCKSGCWDGTCVYKGKYQENEWDGSPEFIHCYKCETPPGPPSCEDLGWGYPWVSDCEKDCPDGECRVVKTSVPGKPTAPPSPPGAPGEPGGEGGAGKGGGDAGGGTTEGGGPASGGGGQPANPPTGTPAQPGTGGGAAASAGGSAKAGEPTDGEPPKKTEVHPAPPPSSTSPTQPPPPTGEKPNAPETQPPQPPDNPDIAFYKTWLEETKERIKSREDIMASPAEGEETKAEAGRQLETMTREREYLEKRIEEKEKDELERRRAAEEAKKRSEEYERTRTRPLDFGEEMRRRSRLWHLAKLREVTEALKAKLQEAKEVLTARRERLRSIDREIAQLEREIKHISEAATEDHYDDDEAETATKARQKRIDDLKKMRTQFARDLQELQRQYDEELARLKSEYQKRYWAVDENARRRAEAGRIDEYFDLYNELRHRRATREARNNSFDQMASTLESAIKEKEAKGEDAGELRRQWENLRRSQAEWNAMMSKQEDNLEEQLHDLGWRNFSEGAGPSSPENLADSLGRYAGYMEEEIPTVERAIAQLEGLSTRTAEQDRQLQDLKAKGNDLRSTVADLKAKQEFVKSAYQLTPEEARRVHDSTTRVAGGALNQDADKSFARLFSESVGEEFVHNLNPLVMGKKTVAYGVGIVEGVGSAVKGLAELVIGADDLILETVAVTLGFDIETDALDALNNALTTVSSHANFDGVIKAVVAAGGALDKKLKEIEKSGDVEWASANWLGEIAGEFVVGDAVVAGAFEKAGTILRGADELADAGGAVGKIDDAADAARAGTKVDDAADGTRVVTHVDDVPPGTAGVETPPARGPPEPGPTAVRRIENADPLPTVGKATAPISDDVLKTLEESQGFRRDHASRMNEFAQEKGVYLIVRDGNPDSVRYFSDPDIMPKPMTCKAKTAKVGPDQGLVVNPLHTKQARYWDEAIEEARKAGDTKRETWLREQRAKAEKEWVENHKKMFSKGYFENSKTGVIGYEERLPDGTKKVWEGIHGDYDLHGVFRKAPDGTMEQVSFGSGQTPDAKGYDIEGRALRQQLNDKLTSGQKDFIQHGGQDDWVPDPSKVPNKMPDPPATVFFPDGRPPVHLKNYDEMKEFYENVMGVKWTYPPKVDKAADAARAAGAADAAQSSGTIPPPTAGGMATKADDAVRAASSHPGVGPNSELNFTAPGGRKVSLRTDQQLGDPGSTSTVYVNAADPTKVIRVTTVGGAVAEAAKLDQFGREALEALGETAALRVVKRYESYAVQPAPGSPMNNKVVEVNERMFQGTAKDVLAEQGGQMTTGQARAFDQATRELNEKGLAWLDNHHRNYTFEKLAGEDQWRVVVMDPGGIVPMKGDTLAEKARNARAIQSRINNPVEDFKASMTFAEHGERHVKMMILAEERGLILQEHGANIDIQAMGLASYDEVGFNPGGVLKYDEVQKLFTMPPESAGQYYGR